jgi:hypothetical protein
VVRLVPHTAYRVPRSVYRVLLSVILRHELKGDTDRGCILAFAQCLEVKLWFSVLFPIP